MVAFTTPDGFIYETNKDQPGTSLRAPDEILAEQVQTKFAGTDTNISDLQSRVTTIENDGILGWTYITHAVASNVASLNIDLTNGGQFPVGTFDMIRLTQRFDLDVFGWVFLQINGSGSTIYNTASIVRDAEGDVETPLHNSAAQSFRIGHGTTSTNNNLICTLINTWTDSFVSYQSRSSRLSGNPAAMKTTDHWGGLTSPVGAAASSLVVSVGLDATEFAFTRYWVEGFRIP